MSQITTKIPPVRVRAAQPADYQGAGELVVLAYRASGQLDDEDWYEQVLFDVAGRAKHLEVLVAFRGEDLVGTATVVRAGQPGAELAHAGELEFRYLGVAPSAWGTGVSDALVRHILATAHDEHLDTVLRLRDGNDAAERLYARHGFVPVTGRDWAPTPRVLLRAMVRRRTAGA